MNHCPICGGKLRSTGRQDDVATEHFRFKCTQCGVEWEETISKSGMRETLHICPVVAGEDG